MITIVDYEAGNLTSVKRALDYLNIENVITSDREVIEQAERVIFPGVGHAASAMEYMKSSGLDVSLRKVFEKGTPLMGICLGTQIILSFSEEGDVDCLNLLEGRTNRFRLTNRELKIPHMGWDRIKVEREHFILKDLKEDDEVYFVHTYYPQPSDSSLVFATCEYEIDFPAAIGRDNLFATQFHPEKSGKVGLQMLTNFSKWDGK